jgi:hypothetical protein
MKKRIIKLTESDLTKMVKRIIKESKYSNKKMDHDLDEGFDDDFIKFYRDDKDYSSEEFKDIPKKHLRKMVGDNKYLRDDSITPGKFVNNKFDDLSDLLRKLKDLDDTDLGYDDEDEEY